MIRIGKTGAAVALIVCVAAAVAEATVIHQGKVVAVGAWQISIQDSSGDIDVFEVAQDARIIHNGKPATLGAVDSGDVAKLTLKTKDGKLVVTILEARDQE